MKIPNAKPTIQPRERRDGSGWFVLVEWGDWPSEQVGGFKTEEEARQWIQQSSPGWLRERLEDRQ